MKSKPNKKTYNEDLLEVVLPGLEEYEKDNDLWVSISRFARFAVLSKLAPQIVDEPFLQIWSRLLLGDRDKKQILFPREHTKSSMAKAFACFILCEPQPRLGGAQVRIAFCGESKAFANRSVKAVRRALETNSWILKEYGGSKPSKELMAKRAANLMEAGIDSEDISPPEWTQGAFRTGRCLESEIDTGVAFEEPSCWAQGMDTSSTGLHMNLAIMDDPVGEKSAHSPARKEKALGVYYDLQSQVISGGLIVDIGTRHAVDDIHATIQDQYASLFDIEVHNCWAEGRELVIDDFNRLDDGSYECKLPLDQVDVFWEGFGQLEEDIRRGEALPPKERKAKALNNLVQKMAAIPSQRWANQYLNRCVAVEDQIFYDWMFKFYEYGRAPFRMANYILTDSATGRDNRSSYRVVATIGLDDRDCAHVRDLEFGRWGPEEYINKILEQHERYGAKRVLMEKVSWQESFKTVMDLKCRLSGTRKPIVIDVPGRSEVSKLERIEGLEPRLRAGKLLFDPKLKDKTSDGKAVWTELKRQFITVHELANVRGLLLDIPDAISDIDSLDAKGLRICRPPVMRRKDGESEFTIDYAANEPLRKARDKPLKGGGLWDRPAKKKTKSLWR